MVPQSHSPKQRTGKVRFQTHGGKARAKIPPVVCKHTRPQWQEDGVASSDHRWLWLMDTSLERRIFTPPAFPYLQPELRIMASEDDGSFRPKYRKLICFILPLLPGLVVLILPLTALTLLQAQKQNWIPIHPPTVFSCWLPLSGEQGQHAHRYPTLSCPVRCEPHKCLNTNSCSLYLNDKQT